MNVNSLIPTETELKQAFEVIRNVQFPSMPDILIQLYAEFEKTEPDTSIISDLVSKDQAITGQVLRTVNSPSFGLGQRVESIQQAVVLLGLQEIRNLVTAAAFKKEIQAKSPVAKQIWHDSVNEAYVATFIAYQVHGVSLDEAYLAALLHNCGALLLAEQFDFYGQFLDLDDEFPVALTKKEIQQIGTSHVVVGFLFAKHWQLPEKTCQAIYLHHRLKCEAIEDAKLRALVATLKLAHLLVREKYLPDGAFPLERIQYFSYAKKELMIDNEHLDVIRADVIREMENI